jgi:uncharacterized membrane protein YhhN
MIIYLLLTLLTGFGHIFWEYKKHYPLIYILKPLTILIIITSVIVLSPMDSYARLIIAGLVFSLFGDFFLMLRQQRFIAGLVSFLIAHFIYSYGFYQRLDIPLQWHYLLYFCVPALLYFAFLYSGLGKLKVPVLVYVSAIVLMTFLSLQVYLTEGTAFALAAFVGALIFMLSDATLALNKFKQPFKAAQLMILTTYYVAQWAIAYSAMG